MELTVKELIERDDALKYLNFQMQRALKRLKKSTDKGGLILISLHYLLGFIKP